MGAIGSGIEAESLWKRHARMWSQLGPPLRPAPEDADFVLRAFRDGAFSSTASHITAAILGVTPEYAALPWPGGVRVIGLDRTEAMIRGVWPCHGQRGRHVVRAEWNRLPAADASIDFIVGDGCFSTHSYPDGHRRLAAEVRRVLRPGGRFAIRCFAAPERRDTPESVHRALRERRYASFDEFRLCLLMAVERDPRRGVRVGDAHEEWLRGRHEPAAVAEANGWLPERLDTIARWRDSDDLLCFPTLDQVREVVGDSFVEKTCHFPGYAFGERFPFLVLEARA